MDKIIQLTGNGRKIDKVSQKWVSKMLGVYVTLSLNQSEQFKEMKKKMYKAIAKLNSMIMKPQLMCLYFNAYLIKSIFFRCRIINYQKRNQ